MKSFLKESKHFNIYSNLLITLLCTSSLFSGYYQVNIDNEVKHANAREIVDNDLEPLSQEAVLGNGKTKKVTFVSKRVEVNASNKSSKTTSSNTGNYAPARYSAVTGEAVVNYAKRYLGLRYVYAGRSLATGTDCSGFTSLIYREFGVKLGVTVQSQLKSGSYIRKSDLQKGDLVFYGYKGRASHVAIYIGNGKVIHESTYKYGVKISPLNMMPYITARRVINAKAIAKVEGEKKQEEKVVEETKVSDVSTTDTTKTNVTEEVTQNEAIETPVTTDTSTTTVEERPTTEDPVVETVSTPDTTEPTVKEEPKVETPVVETPKVETPVEENSVNTETE